MGKIAITNYTKLGSDSGLIEMKLDKKSDAKKLKKGVVAIADPSLILILNVLHGHEVLSTGYLEGTHQTHFVFANDDCIDKHLKHWERVAEDDCDGRVNVFNYMAAFLSESERRSYIKLLDDIQLFNEAES